MHQRQHHGTTDAGAGVFLPTDRPYIWIALASLLSMLVGLARSVWLQIRRRRTIHSLRELDDQTLKDIGVDRSEITSIVDAIYIHRNR